MKLKKFGNTEARIYDLVKPIADEYGLIVWDVRFEKEGACWYLRVMLDRMDEAVTIHDCENVTRPLNKLLDETDPIAQSYTLEVGSAGAERELKRPTDFEQFMGHEVELRLYQPINGSKVFVGELVGYENGDVSVTVGGSTMRFMKSQVALVKLHISI